MSQCIDRMTADNVLLEDPHRTFTVNRSVPDVVRVHHDHWTMPALVHAPGVIDPYDALEPMIRCTFLERLMDSFKPWVGQVLPEVQTKTWCLY